MVLCFSKGNNTKKMSKDSLLSVYIITHPIVFSDWSKIVFEPSRSLLKSTFPNFCFLNLIVKRTVFIKFVVKTQVAY